MGTFKKWVLASLVSVMMVLTFAIGLLPSLGSLGVSAANGERIDFAGLLAKQLGIGKQLQSVEITFPDDGATVLVLPNANNINLPIRARVTPTDAAADVTFGVDGDGTGALTWTGDITSTTVSSAPFIATVNLKQLGDGLFGAHEIYGLANAAKASLAYEVLDVIEIDVQPLFELNGDGRPNNPFALLGPGDIFSSTFDDPNTGNARHVFIADLDVDPNTKALGDLGTVIIPAQVGGLLVTVATAGLQEFVDAGAILPGADAALLVEIAPDLETLLGGVEGLAAANSLYDYPNKELAFGAQFVTIAITYSVDNGVTVVEVDDLPETLPVRLTVEGLAAKQLDATSGVGVWAIPTDISNTNVPSVDEVAGWDKRAGSTLDTFSATLEIYLDRLSVFAALETELAISSIYPEDGAALQPPLVRINGNFPVGAAIDSAAAAAAAYTVYFGDRLASFEVADLVYGGSIVAASYMYVIPPVRADILSDLAVAVSVYDTSAPSDFIIAPAAYTHKFYGVPSITSIVPNAGPLSPVDPDNRVTITGENFEGVVNVTFDGVPGQIVTAKVSSSIAVLPPSTNQAGTVEVFVITPGGSSAPGAYTYQAVPVIADIDPIEGTDAGGDTVTITGLALSNATSVSIAGVPAASFTVDSDSQIRAVTSAAAFGTTGSVVVTTPGGTSAPSAESFTYGSAPTVSDFNPKEGPAAGGTVVVIAGSNFNGVTEVTIAGIAAAVGIYSDTEISVTTGAAAPGTLGKVVVTNAFGTGTSTADYTYTGAAPVIASFNPTQGRVTGGDQVTILGSGFTGATNVTLAGIAATAIQVYSDGEIGATTGAAGAPVVGKVTVTTLVSTATSTGDFSYVAAPLEITDFDPKTGSTEGGESVTITGIGFSDAKATNSVTIAGVVAAFTVYSDTRIDATTGFSATPTVGKVVVSTGTGIATSVADFTYLAPPPPPAIADFNPKQDFLAGGATVVITGTGFTGATEVTLAGLAAQSFTVDSATQITAVTAPSAAPADGPVTVTTPVDTATSVAVFSYVAVQPVITDFNPKVGFDIGGDTIVILGSGFIDATEVKIAGVSAASFIVNNDGEMHAVTSPAADGTTGKVVVTTQFSEATSVANFVYIPSVVEPIEITSVTPDNAWVFGGVIARIEGNGFLQAGLLDLASVTFGGAQASVLEMTDDVLIVNVPAHAAGLVNIEAARNGEAIPPATLADAFTYSDQTTAGGVTTTATTLVGGTGTVTINLGGTDGTANLVIPATVKPGTADRKVLAQAYRDPLLGWTIPAAVVGTAVEDGFIFGIHLFADDPAFAGETPAVGTITLVEGTSTLTDETASASYPIENPALLTTPVGSLNLLKTDIVTGQVVAVGRASVLTHVTPEETPVVVAQADVYQSQIANDNYNELQSTVTDLENVAITSLGTLEIHKEASIDLDVNPTIILERINAKGATSEILTSASVVQANDTIRATADEGGLAYINSVSIYSTAKGTVGTVITELDLVSVNGENSFSVTFQVPDLSGITDQPVTLAIFLPLDPANDPSIVINNAFQITAAGTGNGLIGLLLLLLGGGLALGGGGDGGGGGGPCFIATAAYGTPLAGEIDTLRAVRDAFLLDNAFGTAFVDTYYRVSPAIADVVAQSPMLAAAVRIVLTPVVFLGKVLLAAPALSILSAGLTMGAFWILRRRSRKA